DLFPQKVDYKKLSEDDKVIFRRFQGKTLKSLTDEMMDIGVGKKRAERPPKSWIANWSKEEVVERMSAETEEILCLLLTYRSEESSPVEKQKKKKKTQRTPKNERYEIGSEDLDELLRKIDEKFAAEG
ncbi:hypothetical protein S245_026066, partial [Arachis hypogaea]